LVFRQRCHGTCILQLFHRICESMLTKGRPCGAEVWLAWADRRTSARQRKQKDFPGRESPAPRQTRPPRPLWTQSSGKSHDVSNLCVSRPWFILSWRPTDPAQASALGLATTRRASAQTQADYFLSSFFGAQHGWPFSPG
jgi:hypothetical protein